MNPFRCLQAGLAAITALFLGIIVYASFQESLFAAFPRLWPEIWIQVTLVDFYLGIALFASWVFLRERSRLVALAWLLFGFIPLGNLATLAYVTWALRDIRSRDDLPRLLLGKHAPAA